MGNRETVQRQIRRHRKILLANNLDPYKTPRNVASDKGLNCLLTGFSIKN